MESRYCMEGPGRLTRPIMEATGFRTGKMPTTADDNQSHDVDGFTSDVVFECRSQVILIKTYYLFFFSF